MGSISSRSVTLSAGISTRLIPAFHAAVVFSFSPPMGSTRPVSVSSPVIAVSRRTGCPVSVLTRLESIVTPALGPSLGVAPSGTWMCMSFVL